MMRSSQVAYAALSAAIAAAAAFVTACSGGADPESTPEPTTESPENGFTRAASDFVAALAANDAARFRLLMPPAERPPIERVREIVGSVDLAGCDPAQAAFAMHETTGIVTVDVSFQPPCGEFGVTDGCNLNYRRRDGEWWIAWWTCSTNIADATPTAEPH